MQNEPIKSSAVATNFLWRFLERSGAQGITFIVSIVLARLLDPTAYGTVAIVTVITTILQVFIDGGFGNALIQKKDSDDLDFSTVFWFNILMCSTLYFALFMAAPAISSFFEMEELTNLIRVMGLTLVISGVKNIQQSYVSQKLIFKKFFFATLGGTIIAAAVGIVMAYKGFGAWAIVVQNLANQLVGMIILWITVRFRPKFQFSFARLKALFGFGSRMLLSGLIDTTYIELRQLIIGKQYSSEALAFYNKGEQFPSLLVKNINSSINSVIFPTMSKVQDDIDRVKSITRRSIQISTFIMMPMMMGLAVCADSLVPLILTEKWTDTVFFLRIFCFSYAFYPIATANLSAIKALGRSDLFLKLEIIKKAVGIVAILSTMFISVEALALSLLVTSIASQIINAWPNKRLLKYSYFDQLKDMMPQIVLSIIMGMIVYCVNFLNIDSYLLTLLIQIPFGVFVYVGTAWLFKMQSFIYLLDMAKQFCVNYRKK